MGLIVWEQDACLQQVGAWTEEPHVGIQFRRSSTGEDMVRTICKVMAPNVPDKGPSPCCFSSEDLRGALGEDRLM